MTAWVVIQLSKEYNFNTKNTYVSVTEVAADIRGTCAELKAGDILSVD